MKLNPQILKAYNLMHEGALAFARAEQHGFYLDTEYVENKIGHITRKMERFEKKFKDSDFFKEWQRSKKGKVNINSNVQLAYYLYNVKRIKPAKMTSTGKGSTDEEALKKLNIPELDLLYEKTRYKKPLDVLLGFEREQVNGRVHPFFNLHLPRTYRSSSDSPNFQNIPNRDEEIMQICRKALYPRPGHQLVEIDFSGLEVRIAAAYHKDPTMLKYLHNPASDMHADMTKQIFLLDKYIKDDPDHQVLRYATKNGFVFPEFYGDYFKNCAMSLACNWGKLPNGKWKEGQGIKFEGKHLSDHLISKGISSIKKFIEHIKAIEHDFWTNRFNDYAAWKERWWTIYQKYGYISMLTGFDCKGVMGKNDAINYPVQGAAFHCNLWSFIQLDKVILNRKWDSHIIGQIHDSIILDVHPPELKKVIRVAKKITMRDLPNEWDWINVPLDVDVEICPIDGSWAEKKKYKENV